MPRRADLGRSPHDHGEQGREVAIDGASAGASRENRAGHADRPHRRRESGGADPKQPAEIRDGVDQRGARRRGRHVAPPDDRPRVRLGVDERHVGDFGLRFRAYAHGQFGEQLVLSELQSPAAGAARAVGRHRWRATGGT